MIQNYDHLADSPAHSVALDYIKAGIRATLPAHIVAESVEVADGVLHVADRGFDLSDYDDVFVVGGGNAASQVTKTLEDQLGTTLTGGTVVTDNPAETTMIKTLAGAHPLPDRSSVTSGRRILNQVRSAESRMLILAVVTGGGQRNAGGACRGNFSR